MIQIKKFIDRVSSSESRHARDVVLTLEEARFLRDEIAKLLSDLHDNHSKPNTLTSNESIMVEVVGSKW
jgi:hypothetical protein